MKTFKQFNEDGAAGVAAAGPTSTVGGVAGSGDSRMPASQREPGVHMNKKKKVIMGSLRRRNPPQA